MSLKILEKIVKNFEKIKAVKQWKYSKQKIFREKDLTDEVIKKLFFNYEKKIISQYLEKKKIIDKKFSIIESRFA